MRGRKIENICHICGAKVKISTEHIPPKSSGNSKNVRYYTLDELLSQPVISGEKKLSDMKYHISQGGIKMPTICESCNNYTGGNYVSAYSDFANGIRNKLNLLNQASLINNLMQIKAKIKPLNVIKEIIAMFCSLLSYETVAKLKFNEYVLDKERQDFSNNDFDLYFYLSATKDGKFKYTNPTVIYNVNTKEYVMLAEISAPPLGFILSLTPNIKIEGISNIKYMSKYKLNEECEYNFLTPLLRPIEFPLKFENYELTRNIVKR